MVQQEQITFTRSHPYKKNDQAQVEQKNWSIVRQVVGDDCFEGQRACEALVALDEVVRLYTNFFQPWIKLQRKERLGSIVKKSYDNSQNALSTGPGVGTGDPREQKSLARAVSHAQSSSALACHIEHQQASLWKLAVGVIASETLQAVGSS